MNISIWWIRRDLRLADNQALHEAQKAAMQVIPLFILDPKLLNSPKSCVRRITFLYEGLRELDAALHEKGSRLIVRSGAPLQVFSALRNEVEFGRIFAEEDYSPYARHRDAVVKQQFDLQLCPGLTLLHPESVVKADGLPYTIFTPFSRAWLDRCPSTLPLPAPELLPVVPDLVSEAIPIGERDGSTKLFPASENEAQKRLARFLDEESDLYAEQRDRVDLAGTSSLSPYLRFGLLSARQAVTAAMKRLSWRQSRGEFVNGVQSWLNELVWREFYMTILYHFPRVHHESFKPELRNIRWLNREEEFMAWCEGRTGYPIVDAAMRQLLETGWMHNRARMITASFLTKDLLIDWRWGEAFFMRQLIDGDIAANNGGWQWTAGTGTDAAPYFRIFNPVLQGQKFDPQGSYIRRWLPELSSAPEEMLHTPWKYPSELAGLSLRYPEPIVDHSLARQRCLLAYKGAN